MHPTSQTTAGLALNAPANGPKEAKAQPDESKSGAWMEKASAQANRSDFAALIKALPSLGKTPHYSLSEKAFADTQMSEDAAHSEDSAAILPENDMASGPHSNTNPRTATEIAEDGDKTSGPDEASALISAVQVGAKSPASPPTEGGANNRPLSPTLSRIDEADIYSRQVKHTHHRQKEGSLHQLHAGAASLCSGPDDLRSNGAESAPRDIESSKIFGRSPASFSPIPSAPPTPLQAHTIAAAPSAASGSVDDPLASIDVQLPGTKAEHGKKLFANHQINKVSASPAAPVQVVPATALPPYQAMPIDIPDGIAAGNNVPVTSASSAMVHQQGGGKLPFETPTSMQGQPAGALSGVQITPPQAATGGEAQLPTPAASALDGKLQARAQSAGAPRSLPGPQEFSSPELQHSGTAQIAVKSGGKYDVTQGVAEPLSRVAARAHDAIGTARMYTATELQRGEQTNQSPAAPSNAATAAHAQARNAAELTFLTEAAHSLLAGGDQVSELSFDPGRSIAQSAGTSTPLRADLAPHVARQIVEVVQHAPNRPVEIALSPQELGHVRVSITMEDTGIIVSILAERGETLDLMRRHIDQLGQAFRSLGYDSISFSFGQGAENGAPTDDRAPQSNGPPDTSEDSAQSEPVQINSANPSPTQTATSGVDIRL